MNKDLMKSKRGQITVFIIVGIVIVVAFALFLVFRSQITDLSLSEERRVSAAVPLEYQPVKAFLDQCLRDTATRGLELLGVQGGYLYPDEYGIRAGERLTEGSGEAFFDSGSVIPYWYHMSSDNDCQAECEFTYQIPGLRKSDGTPNFESDLARFVDENLASCTDDFASFEDEGFVVRELSSPRTEVTIAESTVNFLLNYELRVDSQNAESTDIAGSFSSIVLNLEDIYLTAQNLARLQQEYQYLDEHDLNLIYGLSGIDEDKLPPPSDTDFDTSGGVSWNPNEVRDQLVGMLASNVRLLQVPESLNYEYRPADNEHQEAYLNRGTNVPLPEDNPSVEDYEIGFEYVPPLEGRPLYFHINCDGGCTPQSASSNLLMLIGIQRYQFFYDVSFPVLVTIKSPYELTNQLGGYRFQYLLESNVRNNDPLTAASIQLSGVSGVASDIGLCDVGKRNSGEVTITVLNHSTQEPVKDAGIVYSCAEESCAMGKTNAEGIFVSAFPTCLGGIVQAQAGGAEPDSKPLSLNVGDEKEVELSVKPHIDVPIILLKKMLDIDDKELDENPIPLEPSETAIVTLERITTPTEVDYFTTAIINSEEESPILRLSAGRYKVSISVFDEGESIVVIEDEEVGSGLNKETIPGAEMDSFKTGGAELEIVITEGNLARDTMVLYTLAVDNEDITSWNDMEIYSEYEPLSQSYRSSLLPVFT